MKRRLALILAALLCLSACGKESVTETAHDPVENSAAAETEPAAVQDETEAEAVSSVNEYSEHLLDLTEEELMKKLGMSITEGGLSGSKDAISKRFDEYKELGITCVRIDTSWDTSTEGVWKMSGTTKNYLEAAREHGLLLKLILPTIMAPPSWISSKAGARLVDYNGRKSVNTVSYWYEGVNEYCACAVDAQMKAIADGGWQDVVGAVIIDMGPAGEPLYPPAWTQVSDGLSGNDNGAEVMWCYGDNAQADFRAKMAEAYSTIEAANEAWGTSYASFDEIEVPKPEEIKGKMWEDTLLWYRDTKRAFMSAQVDTFKKAAETYGLSTRPLIIYLPGAEFNAHQWKGCVKNGTAINQVKIFCDNEYAVTLAAEKGCVLQYTGITGTDGLRLTREFMYENGYGSIPVFGENAGDPGAAGNPKFLADIIVDYSLFGIDYTHSHYLYEEDGTPSRIHKALVSQLPVIAEHLENLDLTELPPAIKK